MDTKLIQTTAYTTESSGSVTELKNTMEGKSKGGFSSAGNCCIAVCLTVKRHRIKNGHISKTHIHSNQYNLFKFINIRARGKKTALWNQTLPFLLWQLTIWRTALSNANIQDKTNTQACAWMHTRTRTYWNLPGHIVDRQNNSLFQKIKSNNPCSETLLGGFKVLNQGWRWKTLFLVSLLRPRQKLCIFKSA